MTRFEQVPDAAAASVREPNESASPYLAVQRGKIEWERTCDAITDLIAVFDREGRLMRGNAALAAFRGWPITSIPGRTCTDVGLCGTACPGTCAVGQAARTRRESRAELTMRDGRVFLVTTMPVVGLPDVSVVQVAKDVTEERRAAEALQSMAERLGKVNAELNATVERLTNTQAALVQFEKLAAIGRLVGGVAHELNNPLTTIIGYAQLVEEELRSLPSTEGDQRLPQLAADVSCIAEEGQRAAKIIRNLLAFARRQSGERGRHDVRELVERVLELRAHDHQVSRIAVTTWFEPGLPKVLVDAQQVQQAILNVVLNAEQAMGASGGRLEVGARHDVSSGSVVISVKDEGPGIDPQHTGHLFDPFFTTRSQGHGSGLGLSICYGVVRDHGGHIWAESGAGSGTTVCIQIPSLADPDGRARPLRLMVAHPDSAVREFLAAVCTGWGHQVATASGAAEALATYQQGDLDAAVVDWSFCDGCAEEWRGGPAPLILTSLEHGAGNGAAQARHLAAASVGAPFYLDAVWRAIRTAVGEQT